MSTHPNCLSTVSLMLLPTPITSFLFIGLFHMESLHPPRLGHCKWLASFIRTWIFVTMWRICSATVTLNSCAFMMSTVLSKFSNRRIFFLIPSFTKTSQIFYPLVRILFIDESNIWRFHRCPMVPTLQRRKIEIRNLMDAASDLNSAVCFGCCAAH